MSRLTLPPDACYAIFVTSASNRGANVCLCPRGDMYLSVLFQFKSKTDCQGFKVDSRVCMAKLCLLQIEKGFFFFFFFFINLFGLDKN